MSTTVAAYNVAFNLNAKGLIDSSKLARNEVKSLGSLFRGQVTDAEKYAAKLTLLEKALASGAIGSQAYNESLKRLKATQAGVSKGFIAINSSLDKQHRSFGTATASMLKYAAGIGGVYAAIHGSKRLLDGLTGTVERLDQLSKEAKRLGLSVNDLQKFTYALDEMAGIDSSAAGGLLEGMSVKIGQASLGKGKAKPYLEALGLDAATLSRQSPVAQFEKISEAIRKQGDQSQKLAIATALFGDEGTKLLPILNATADEWNESTGMVEKLGLAVDDFTANKMENVNDSFERAQATIKGVMQTLTIEFADTLKASADHFTELGGSMQTTASNMKDNFDKVTWSLNIMTLQFEEAAKVHAKYNKRNEWNFGFDADSTKGRMDAARKRGDEWRLQQEQIAAKERKAAVPNPFKEFKEVKEIADTTTKGGLETFFPGIAKAIAVASAAATAAVSSGEKKIDMSQGNTLFDANSQEYYKFMQSGKKDVEEQQLKEMQQQKVIWKGIGKAIDVAVERLTTIAETRITKARP